MKRYYRLVLGILGLFIIILTAVNCTPGTTNTAESSPGTTTTISTSSASSTPVTTITTSVISPATSTVSQSVTPIPVYGYEIEHVYPHDTAAFTEGLVYDNGFFFESTGLNGQSSLRQVVADTGEIVQQYDLPEQYFGEGIALYDDRILQLTWKSGTGFIYNQDDFSILGQFSYEGEGWGLTRSESGLIMSDGTARLRILDFETLQPVRYIEVTASGEPVINLNELEYINGKIYANVWQTDKIAVIDPDSGHVTAWIDLTGLLAPQGNTQRTDVLNGIAYKPGSDNLFVTGKLWPYLFEIRLTLR